MDFKVQDYISPERQGPGQRNSKHVGSNEASLNYDPDECIQEPKPYNLNP